MTHKRTHRIACLSALATALLVAPACKTTRYTVAAGAPTYAADANIKIKPNKTGNGEIFINVEHLAPPKRIGKSNAGYVVWLKAGDQAPIKLGALEYDEKKRRGRLHATTPQKSFELLISLEKSLSVQAASGEVIVRQTAKNKA